VTVKTPSSATILCHAVYHPATCTPPTPLPLGPTCVCMLLSSSLHCTTLSFSKQQPHMRLQVLSTAARPSLGSSTAQTPLGCPTPPLCTPLHQALVKAVSGPSLAAPPQRFSRPILQVGLTIQLDGHRIILTRGPSKLAQLEEGQSHHRPG